MDEHGKHENLFVNFILLLGNPQEEYPITDAVTAKSQHWQFSHFCSPWQNIILGDLTTQLAITDSYIVK